MSNIRDDTRAEYAKFMLVCLVAKLTQDGVITSDDVSTWLARGQSLLARAGLPGGPPLSFTVSDAERPDFLAVLQEASDEAAATFAWVMAGGSS